MAMNDTLMIVLIVIVVAIWLVMWWRSRVRNLASGMAQQVFPVWAAQGPFESGRQSATAMRYAYIAALGPEQAESMTDAIGKHEQAFDEDPAQWEQVRQTSLRSSNSGTADLITIAEGLAAMDALNKDLLEEGGHKLEYARNADGSVGIAYKQLWSDEEIAEKKERDRDALTSAVGTKLLDNSSREAHELVQFLSERSKDQLGSEASSAEAIGAMFIACSTMQSEYPELELSKEFERLYTAYQATLAESDD